MSTEAKTINVKRYNEGDINIWNGMEGMKWNWIHTYIMILHGFIKPRQVIRY